MNNKTYVPPKQTMEKIEILFRSKTNIFVGTLAVEIGYSLLKTEMIIDHLIDKRVLRYATPQEAKALGFDETYQILIKTSNQSL